MKKQNFKNATSFLEDEKKSLPFPIVFAPNQVQNNLLEILDSRIDNCQIAIITDREVSGYYISEFIKQFQQKSIPTTVILVETSSNAKSFDAAKQVFERLADINFHHKDLLIGLGGGGVLDIAGFVSSLFKNKVDCVQIPTSLLAMVDSVISGEAYLNFQSYKNHLGIAFQPYLAIIDIHYLNTLSLRIRANGIAQILQYGLVYEPKLLDTLAPSNADFEKLIKDCLAIRTSLCPIHPEFLAFGQIIAEAIEGHFRFLKYSHGEAMALGMLALYPSAQLHQLYQEYGLPTKIEGVTIDTLIKRIIRSIDESQKPFCLVCLEKPGNPYLEKITTENLPTVFQQFLSQIT